MTESPVPDPNPKEYSPVRGLRPASGLYAPRRTQPSECLRILAGPYARQLLLKEGLCPEQPVAIPAAAGGPKALILGPIDRYLFGEFLPRSAQGVDLLGASVGCWRLAAACCPEPATKLQQFSEAYIEQDYRIPLGRRRPDPKEVSAAFAAGLERFFGPTLEPLVSHRRYRLHVLCSRGVGWLAQAARSAHRAWSLPMTLGLAWIVNALSRQALGDYLRRVVFSPASAQRPPGQRIDWGDYPSDQVALTEANVLAAIQASCSIPMLLEPVVDPLGAPPGPYWDGGLTDYHLHLDYRALAPGLVLYPHFLPRLIPGWLDKAWPGRQRASAGLDPVVILAPTPSWVARLPDARLPDRHDFVRFAHDPRARMRRWRAVLAQSEELAEALDAFVRDPRCIEVEPLERAS